MDCTDIVIGTAKGEYSRIADYYTRDRSTPRLDSFFGEYFWSLALVTDII